MTVAPALSVGLRSSRAARGAVVVLVAVSLVGLLAWCLSGFRVGLGVRAAALVAASAAVALAGVMWPSVERRLRWDGRQWFVGQADRPPEDDRPAEVEVMLDLGACMLLRVRAESASGRGRVAWLAVQPGSVEGSWHGLRCALYSPRPAPGGAAADEPALPSA